MSGLFSSDTKALAETHLPQLKSGWLWECNCTEFGCSLLLGGKQCHSADVLFLFGMIMINCICAFSQNRVILLGDCGTVNIAYILPEVAELLCTTIGVMVNT